MDFTCQTTTPPADDQEFDLVGIRWPAGFPDAPEGLGGQGGGPNGSGGPCYGVQESSACQSDVHPC